MKKTTNTRNAMRRATTQMAKLTEKCMRHWPGVLTTMSLMVLLFVCFGYRSANGVGVDHTRQFVAVIDAGSTGTRIYVYAYDPTNPYLYLTWIPPEAAPHMVPYRPGIRAYHRVETLPGLQSIAQDALGEQHNISALYAAVDRKAIGPLLKWAYAVIPPRKQSQTPLHLLATAGVRGLTDAQQTELLGVLSETLLHSGFDFGTDGIEIMSGHREGIFGWVALNHQLGTFNVSVPTSTKTISLSRKELPSPSLNKQIPITSAGGASGNQTVHRVAKQNDTSQRIGALDLGGSSLEVTFPSLQKTSEELEIAGDRYWLQSKTFDHLGLNSAFDRSVWLLAREANQTGSSSLISLHHPCMFDGYNATVIVRPPKDFPGVDTSFPAIHAELIGAPSWTQCEHLVQKVIAVSSSCATSPCFGGAADLKDLRFVGLNGFHVVWSFFHLTSIAPLTDLEHAGQTYCRRSWDSIQQDYKDVVQFDKFCFRSAYVLHLLQSISGYRIADTVHIASDSVSWPTGAAYLTVQPTWLQQRDRYRRRDAWHLDPPVAMAGLGLVLIGCVCVRLVQRTANHGTLGDQNPFSDASLRSASRLHRVNEIKRRTFSYKRLHELSL